jgi:hypothetical protein
MTAKDRVSIFPVDDKHSDTVQIFKAAPSIFLTFQEFLQTDDGKYIASKENEEKARKGESNQIIPKNGLTFWLSAKRGVSASQNGNLIKWSNPFWPEGQFDVIPNGKD